MIFIAVPGDQADKIAKIETMVPHISVQSNLYSPFRAYSFVGAIWLAWVCGSFWLQFGSQFSMPHAQLAPKYKQRHQVSLWVTCLLLVTALTLVTCLLGGASWPIVAVSILSVVVLGALSGYRAHRLPQQAQSSIGTIVRIASVFFMLGLVYWIYRHPLELESYLLGHQIWIAVALLLISLLLVPFAAFRYQNLCRDRYESSRPLMFSIPDFQKAVAQINVERQIGAGQNAATAIGVLVVVVAAYYSILGDSFKRYIPVNISSGMMVYLCFLALVISMFAIGAKWWKRIPAVGMMLTRPPARRNQIDQLLLGIGKDFGVKAIPILLACCILSSVAPIWATSNRVAIAAVSVVFMIAALYFLYAVVVWAMLIRNVFAVYLVGCLMLTLLGLVSAICGIIGNQQEGLTPLRVMVTSAVIVVLASVAFVTARRKYMRYEWARFM